MVLQKIASSTARATSGIRTMSAASAAASRLRKLPEFRVELAPQAVSAAGEGQQHGVASYGSWTATQQGSARADRVAAASEFLNRKVQAQPEPAMHQPAPSDGSALTAPLQDHALPSDASFGAFRSKAAERRAANISCRNMSTAREARVGQVQRFFDATRDGREDRRASIRADTLALGAVGGWQSIAGAVADPIVVSELPLGWTISEAASKPVFSFGQWAREAGRADGSMSRTDAARQFLRYR